MTDSDKLTRNATTVVGTSGWQYKHWRKLYYPENLPMERWLSYYARDFRCVEVNSSFYKLTEWPVVEKWCKATPEGFQFALKAPRTITHYKKLKNCEESLARFLSWADAFGQKRGPILFQLPPNWQCNVKRLAEFLELLSDLRRYVFEFRDSSWHCDEVFRLLEDHDTAFCIYDLDGSHAPLVTTAQFAYVRLHGPRAAYTGNYRAPALRTWAGRALSWNRTGQDVFIFFDNDDRAYSVKNARRMPAFLHEDVSRSWV